MTNTTKLLYEIISLVIDTYDPTVTNSTISTVLFDFGGVITTSPFEAFSRYEQEKNLPDGLIRKVNTSNSNDNAWAKLERGDVTTGGFAALFEEEARSLGYEVKGGDVLGLLSGALRPQMASAVRSLMAAGKRVACLTNNFAAAHDAPLHAQPEVQAVFDLFEEVFESSRLGVRKPEPEFYQRALDVLGVQPSETVFLDDLGINLKPARAMGMTTIKVVDPDQALAELGQILGMEI